MIPSPKIVDCENDPPEKTCTNWNIRPMPVAPEDCC